MNILERKHVVPTYITLNLNFFSECLAVWNDVPDATQRSWPRSWWCEPETWCSMSVASHVPPARFRWPRAITSGWGMVQCSVDCITRWARSCTRPKVLRFRFIRPVRTIPVNRSPRRNSFTTIIIIPLIRLTRITRCILSIPTAT